MMSPDSAQRAVSAHVRKDSGAMYLDRTSAGTTSAGMVELVKTTSIASPEFAVKANASVRPVSTGSMLWWLYICWPFPTPPDWLASSLQKSP